MIERDVVVIGGGQAGLAAGFHLTRAGADFEILDAAVGPGGAWPHTWPSLRLFSPAEYSSLPGMRMPRTSGGNPDAAHVVGYLRAYEQRYALPVTRPVRVESVENADGGGFVVRAEDRRRWHARAVISATGTWSRPFVPAVPGLADFRGEQLHSAAYRGPESLAGRRVLVVGGANSGAQIAADLAGHVDLTWCALAPPRYLPDHVDGRELFRVATAAVRGGGAGVAGLGDIVVVPPVRAARDAGLLVATPMVDRFTADGVAWDGGSGRTGDDDEVRPIDTVIWCTGFRPALAHLSGLRLPRRKGRPVTEGPGVPGVPGLFLLGYGDWCGAASATLAGVGQWARAAVADAVGGQSAAPA